MMKRKIVKQGAATMMISLPSKWIKKNKLEKGDEINLEEKENDILISTEKALKEKSRSIINISGLSPLVNRTLISLYIKGIDELEVNFDDKKEIEDFQKQVINELLGFEIIKQSQKTIVIKDITGFAEQDFDDLIKRIFLILDSMAEELLLAAEKKQSMDPVIETDSSVNKFVSFCLRILNKKGYKEQAKTPQVYAIISGLEEIGDVYKKVEKELQKNNKISSEELNTLHEIREFLNNFKDLFFHFNREKSVKFAKEYEHIKKKIIQKNLIDFDLYQLNESIIKLLGYVLVISD
jgi:phosphate uptake regulator